MKILQVVPSSGDSFYCENCVRDNALLRALVHAGANVVAVPLYLPQVRDRVTAVSESPIFFGGINSYLQQKSGIFRHTPRWLDRFFDSRWLLRLAARRAGTVRASDLGSMTLSMLRGADGNQAKELERLLQWMQKLGAGPEDVVHVSNPFLLGIGVAAKRRFGSRLVCSLQDEHTWIDAMHARDADDCWREISALGREVDAFHAVSRYYGDLMQERLGFHVSRLHVVHVGVDVDLFDVSTLPYEPPVLGFLSRLSEPLGLGVLVDAFVALKRRPGLESLRLHLCGGATGDDRRFLRALHARVRNEGMDGDLEFFDDIEPTSRRAFLRGLTVLSVPSPEGTAFGTYILESLAAGVPVVQPKIGAFPELIEATGGGVVYEPNDATTLAATLGDLLLDRERLAELGRSGRHAMETDFHARKMAERILEMYRGLGATARPEPSSAGGNS